jgi:hypothetical protein
MPQAFPPSSLGVAGRFGVPYVTRGSLRRRKCGGGSDCLGDLAALGLHQGDGQALYL